MGGNVTGWLLETQINEVKFVNGKRGDRQRCGAK
jgi:hypothetical protein